MLPFPDAFRRGYASWLRWKEDSKLVPIMVDNSWAVLSMAFFLELIFLHYLPSQQKQSDKNPQNNIG